MLYLMEFLYFAIPVAAIIFFVVSLCLYLSAKKQNKLQPGSVSTQTLRSRKTMLIVSSVIAGVLVVVFLAFVALLFMAVAFMCGSSMKDRTYLRVLLCVIGLCLVLTLAHMVYAVYAYQHCSIIEFIARELW